MQKKKPQNKTQKNNALPSGETLLVIDSSSAPLLVGIACGGKTYGAAKEGIKQEEYLFPLITGLCKKAKIKFKDIKQVFFIKGPGRFTGIRIAITLASVLKELCGAKVFSATVFDALKEQVLNDKTFEKWRAENKEGFLVCVTHAFRKEYFACAYRFNGTTGAFAAPQNPLWLDAAGLEEYFARLKAPLFIVGSGEGGTALKSFLPSRAKYFYARGAANKVCVQTLFALALQKINAPAADENIFTPLYLKPARFELSINAAQKAKEENQNPLCKNCAARDLKC